ncbi:hypothetical protein BH09PAT4_BH09PAT4_01980 [soil metagenome]
MPKRAVILHGTDGNPDQCWMPWLRKLLEAHGYQVFAPVLPSNHTPSREGYLDFLFSQDWDYTDNVVIGHSSGATTIFNMLEDARCSKLKAAVPVASFLKITAGILESEWYDPGQFDALFPENGFSWEAIQGKCDAFYFVHGSDDPFCPIELAQHAADRLGGELLVIKNAGHLGESSGFRELPQLEALLLERGLI